jgi:hypothetical protein
MNILHKRAWVVHGGKHTAVAYCRASEYQGKQPSTTDNMTKVNCPRCKSIAEGNG